MTMVDTLHSFAERVLTAVSKRYRVRKVLLYELNEHHRQLKTVNQRAEPIGDNDAALLRTPVFDAHVNDISVLRPSTLNAVLIHYSQIRRLRDRLDGIQSGRYDNKSVELENGSTLTEYSIECCIDAKNELARE